VLGSESELESTTNSVDLGTFLPCKVAASFVFAPAIFEGFGAFGLLLVLESPVVRLLASSFDGGALFSSGARIGMGILVMAESSVSLPLLDESEPDILATIAGQQPAPESQGYGER
jgi:hypothetical protein